MAFKLGRQKGFTIIELMIAMSIFAVAMTIITTGVIFIGRQYKQAVSRVKLEDSSREIHQQIAQSIQFAGTEPTADTSNGTWVAWCVGDKKYTFAKQSYAVSPTYTATEYTALSKGLYMETVTPGVPCAFSSPTTNPLAVNLLPKEGVVMLFWYDIAQKKLTTKFAMGEEDLLGLTSTATPVDTIFCKTNINGKEYCAVVQLSSTAIRRVTN